MARRDLRAMKRVCSLDIETDGLVAYSHFETHSSLPCLVRPRFGSVDIISWAATHRKEISDKLAQFGCLLFRGFNVTGAEELEKLVVAISGYSLNYQERSSPRASVGGNIYTSTEHPPDQPIFLHNENSYQKIWPMKLFFLCDISPQVGGETPIADCRRVLARIDADIITRFEARGFRIVRNYHLGMGLSWPTVFGTEDPDTVDAYCRENDIQTQWKKDGGLRTITIRDATAHHPKTGEKVWFNHGLFFHVTTLPPPLADVLLQKMAAQDLTTNNYYGDGEPIEPEVLAQLKSAYTQEMVRFPWQKNDVLLLDNMLCAHGRSTFQGPRRILVAMSEPMGRSSLPKKA